MKSKTLLRYLNSTGIVYEANSVRHTYCMIIKAAEIKTKLREKHDQQPGISEMLELVYLGKYKENKYQIEYNYKNFALDIMLAIRLHMTAPKSRKSS